jgi:hypothetical protein
VETGRRVLECKAHEVRIGPMAFLPDRCALVTASADTSLLVWDTASIQRRRRPGKAVDAAGLESCWQDLSREDAPQAFRAVIVLGDAGEDAVAFLRARLSPSPVDGDLVGRIRRWIADLDHDDIVVRERAAGELQKTGSAAAAELRKALDVAPSAEARIRLEALVLEAESDAPLPVPLGESLRRHRAIRALERVGTVTAREALEALARESLHPRERRGAAAAAARLRALE